jgi:FolB domain-containing protein
MSDRLAIIDLELWTKLGVTAEERSKPQKISVSVWMDVNAKTAAASDDVTKTIDYAAVARDIEALMTTERNTMERLAEDVAAMILRNYKPKNVTVNVMKFVLKNAKGAHITIDRP